MALKIISLVKKNLMLLLRNRSSAMILVLGPLLLIVLMSVAFSSANAYGIIVGVYSKEYSTLTNSLLDGLKQKQMSIVQMEDQEKCIDCRACIDACPVQAIK